MRRDPERMRVLAKTDWEDMVRGLAVGSLGGIITISPAQPNHIRRRSGGPGSAGIRETVVPWGETPGPEFVPWFARRVEYAPAGKGIRLLPRERAGVHRGGGVRPAARGRCCASRSSVASLSPPKNCTDPSRTARVPGRSGGAERPGRTVAAGRALRPISRQSHVHLAPISERLLAANLVPGGQVPYPLRFALSPSDAGENLPGLVVAGDGPNRRQEACGPRLTSSGRDAAPAG
jgi:hypothetical protein